MPIHYVVGAVDDEQHSMVMAINGDLRIRTAAA